MLDQSKNMVKIVSVLCIAALSGFASISHADDWGCDGGHCIKHQSNNFKQLAKKLGLTDAQKAQAKAISMGNKEVVKPIFASLHAEQKNLHALMHADIIDEVAIRAETAKIAVIQADLNVNKATVRTQLHAILTPGQQAILKTLRRKGHKKDGTKSAPAE